MPLVSVVNQDRKIRKLVSVETLQELTTSACQKLSLPDGEYKVYIDGKNPDAGLEIDDEMVFKELLSDSSKSQSRLIVMILPENTSWQAEEDAPATNNQGPPQTEEIQRQPDVVLQLQNLQAPGERIVLETPLIRANTTDFYPPLTITKISKLLAPVLEELSKPVDEQPKNLNMLKETAIRNSVKEISDFIVNLKDFRRKTCVHYANSVFSYENQKFAPIFHQYVNNVHCGNGFDSFALKIYNGVQYRKGDTLKKKRGKRSAHAPETLEEVEDPDDPENLVPVIAKKPRRRTYGYGCINYAPPLPEGETAESQNSKRIQLAEHPLDPSSQDVMKLWVDTHALQRSDINACKPLKKLVQVFDRWPPLSQSYFFLKHAKILIGETIIDTWGEQLGLRADDIVSFMKEHWVAEAAVSTASRAAKGAKLLDLIRQKESACVRERSTYYNSIAVFPLVCAYMAEKFDFLVQVVQGEKTKEEILQCASCSNGNPILIVNGDSLFDEKASCSTVIINKVMIESVDILEGILVTFLSFFVFDVCYTRQVQSTLEFIQRFFLQINPKEGDRRENPKRYVGTVDTKVQDLSEELKTHSSHWTILPLE